MSAAQQGNIRFEQFAGPLAFLADVHGNIEALDAVIRECKAAGVSAYFVAGDLVFRGANPLQVWMRLMEINARCTRGTSDIALVAVDPEKLQPKDDRERQAVEQFKNTRTALGELILAHMRKLPDILRIELRDGSEIAMTHGSPRDPTESITHDQTDEEVSALLGHDPADVLVCGGSHVPFVREVGGVRVVGAGSVGEAMGDRVAHYVLIEPGTEGLIVDPHWVSY